MKNKKGFTLVEILAVIVILSVLIIIAAPVVQNALSASNHGMSEFEKSAITDSAETIVLEVIGCDIDNKIRNVLNVSDTLTCTEINDLVVGHTITMSVQDLRTNGFLNDVGERCNGNISVTTDAGSYQVTVNTDNVTCG